MHTKFHEVLKLVGINVIYVGMYCETANILHERRLLLLRLNRKSIFRYKSNTSHHFVIIIYLTKDFVSNKHQFSKFPMKHIAKPPFANHSTSCYVCHMRTRREAPS